MSAPYDEPDYDEPDYDDRDEPEYEPEYERCDCSPTCGAIVRVG